jgi:hypothetical protein
LGGEPAPVAARATTVAAGDDAGTPEAPEPTPTPSTPGDQPSPTATGSAGNAPLFGTSVATDYTAKHFSIIAGAAVLNRFKLTPTPAESPDGTSTSYTLDSGSTVARAFLEGNVRYRWAWLDRLSAEQAALSEALADPRVQAAAAKRDATAKLNRAALEADTTAPTVGTQDDLSMAATAKTEAELRYSEILRSVYQEKIARSQKEWQRASTEVPVTGIFACMDPGKTRDGQSRGEQSYGECLASQLIPQDWEARLGYVFDSGSSSGTAGIPAANDLYGGLALGWNLVRWSFPTSSWTETPLRGSINFEPAISVVSDSNFNDVHEQYFIGASTAIGVPIRWKTSGTSTTIGELAARDASGGALPIADPVVEFLARIGATRVDVPVFLSGEGIDSSTSKLVKSRHGQPAFRGEWGLGLDFELNVPVPNNLGYVVARGLFSAELDPDPWALQLGYTIPISNLISGLGGTNP